MTVPRSRDYYTKKFGMPTDIANAKRHIKTNPSFLEDKTFYLGLYSSIMDDDLKWVKMIVEQGKNHLPPERRKGMLSFSGWLQLAITNEHEHLTDYLLNELLNDGIDEDNFEELWVHSVNYSEHKVLHALLHYGVHNLDANDSYFEACCAATEHEDTQMYQIILPLVVSTDWDALENYLLERSLVNEHTILQQHKSTVQRQKLQECLPNGVEDTLRKI